LPIRTCLKLRLQPRNASREVKTMPQKIRTQFGFKGNLEEVEFEIPDNEPHPWNPNDSLNVVSRAMPRLDGRAKVTGEAKYTYDINRPGMLYGRILRSPYAAAE